jgi:hypothetical protein
MPRTTTDFSWTMIVTLQKGSSLVVVAIKPKPAFRSLFCISTMEEGSGIVLVTCLQADHDEGCCPAEMTRPPDDSSEGLGAPCLWWRRGRVELPVQRALKGIYSRRIH